MTAPALYRYVASYQELVDLVAFEIDKAATETFAAAADALPEDDYAGRLVASTVEFRMWALANPREFGLAFANPIADAKSVRREMLTLSCSGHLCTDQMRALWEHNHHPIPAARRAAAGGSRGGPRPADPGQGRRTGDRGPRPALGLHAGLERALRRGRARGVRPHGPADHRVRRDVRPRGARVRAQARAGRRRRPPRGDHPGPARPGASRGRRSWAAGTHARSRPR